MAPFWQPAGRRRGGRFGPAFLLLLLATVWSGACRAPTATPTAGQPAAEAVTATPIPAATPSATPTRPLPTFTPPPPTATLRPTVTLIPTATATPGGSDLPAGACVPPPDDYTRVVVNGHTISARTLAMLKAAQRLYPGPGDLLRLTQGSYRDDVSASFGTHAGGGAVDISIRDPRQAGRFLWEEAEAMVAALRYAGFAAWYRAPGDLGPGSAAHIHAIAVGDAELSEAAQEQVTGAGGYLNGMDGLVPPYGPNPDPHGGPVNCPWMAE